MSKTTLVLTILLATAFIFTLSRCASRSVLPDVKEVKMSRETPRSNCEEIGRVTGSTTNAKAKPEEVLADMQDDAAKKGANYVQVGEYSSLGTSVVGVAFKCP